jgi:hypothetical protein
MAERIPVACVDEPLLFGGNPMKLTPAQIADPPSQRCVKWGPASRLPTLTPPYALTSSKPISRSCRACAAQIAAVRTIG